MISSAAWVMAVSVCAMAASFVQVRVAAVMPTLRPAGGRGNGLVARLWLGRQRSGGAGGCGDGGTRSRERVDRTRVRSGRGAGVASGRGAVPAVAAVRGGA